MGGKSSKTAEVKADTSSKNTDKVTDIRIVQEKEPEEEYTSEVFEAERREQEEALGESSPFQSLLPF